jgi:hypothetical protein
MRKVVLGCLILFTMGIVSAQDFNLAFTSKTPFTVGNGNLPAGSYQIRPISEEGTFECSAASGQPAVLFEAEPMETVPAKTDLTFVKYGDKMLVKSFSVEGVQGYTIPVSLYEKHHKKTTSAKPTKVSVMATKQ